MTSLWSMSDLKDRSDQHFSSLAGLGDLPEEHVDVWALPKSFERVGILCVKSLGMKLTDGICLEKNLLQHMINYTGRGVVAYSICCVLNGMDAI